MTQFQISLNKTVSYVSNFVLFFSILTLSITSTNLSQAAAPQTTMKTGQGKEMTLTLKDLPNSRGYVYCELVFDYGSPHGSDIYSTSPLAPCDSNWWDNLDVNTLAKEFGAKSVAKNGPQRWSMDEVSLMLSAPVTVAGVNMVFGGVLPAGTLSISHYTVFNPAKFQNLVWKAGQPTYQLVDPNGHVYIVQGYKVHKEDLAMLSSKFKQLPKGWKYQVVSPTHDLVMELTPDKPIPSVQDEFNQIYIRIPE